MTTKNLDGRVQIKRDTAANWVTNNPVLLAGEFGYETDTKFLKIGDGTTAWNSLKYTFRNINYVDVTIDTSSVTSSNTLTGYSYVFSHTVQGLTGDYYAYTEITSGGYPYEFLVQTATNTLNFYFVYAPTSNFTVRVYLDRQGFRFANVEQGQSMLPITVTIEQTSHQTISVTGSVSQTYSFTSSGTIPVIETVSLAASIEADNGYEAGTLVRTTATPTWGDTVVFSASPATEAVVNPQEDLSSFTLVGTYSDEGINLNTLNYGVRQSTLKRTAVSVSGYNTLMVEIEFQTDGILAFDPVKTFEFSCQATSHNNAAWNMTYSDIAGYQDTNQVSVRCQILETWCTNGTHGSCWNEEITVGGNTVYVTKLRWMERISDITWAEWIDGKPNTNRCFFAGGVRISLLNEVNVVNYYHRFYLGNLSS